MSATEQPPLKRLRPSSNDDDPSTSGEPSDPEIARSQKLWYEDGSVVIQAESTQFRVHKTMLSRSSTIFQDVFQFGDQSATEFVVEGCPVVHVSDSAVDMRHFLLALYANKYDPDEKPSIAQITAMLRLGKKYDVESLYQDALRKLQLSFPTSLKLYDARRPTEHFYLQPDSLFDIVNLASEMSIHSILPVALFHCAGYTTTTLLRGIRRDDGTYAKLVPQVLNALLIGRESIFQTQPLKTFKYLGASQGSPLCNSVNLCAQIRASVMEVIYQMGPLTHRALQKPEWHLPRCEKLCVSCYEQASSLYTRGREDMWEALPLCFGWQNWDQVLSPDLISWPPAA